MTLWLVLPLLFHVCCAQFPGTLQHMFQSVLDRVEEYDRCQSDNPLLNWKCPCPVHTDYVAQVEKGLTGQLFGQDRAREELVRALKAHDFQTNNKPTVIHISGVCTGFPEWRLAV